MSDLVIRKENESFVTLECDEDLNNKFYNLFSAYMPGYRFNPRFKNHLWDGKLHCYSPITQTLPIGLVRNLINYCKNKNINYELEDLDDMDDVIDKSEMEKTINSFIDGFDARDYQVNAVYEALTHKKGVLLSCTGSGKSLMIYSFMRYLLQEKNITRMCLIVPSVSLVEQMFSDFRDYGWEDLEDNVEMLYSGQKPTFKKPILISTWQSLEKEDKEFFEPYEAVVVDECHSSKSTVVSKILKSCINAKYKIGTSGTLPTELADQLQINAVLGNVMFELKSNELIQRGYLTKLDIASIFLKYPDDFIKENKDRTYQEEVKMVEEYENRNSVLKFVLNHTPVEHNVLILVNHRNHLSSVKSYLEKMYPDKNIKEYNGSVKASARESIRKNLEYEDGTIIVGTYSVCSTGINIPKLHSIMMFSNSKSRIKVLQSIGRGLRLHKTKNKVIIYDIVDDLSYKTRNGRQKKNYCMQHYDERLTYYLEQEFPVVSITVNV